MSDKKWKAQLADARLAMVQKLPVYILDGKKYVEAEILKLDENNRVFTALLRLGKGHLKWTSLDNILVSYEPESAEESA